MRIPQDVPRTQRRSRRRVRIGLIVAVVVVVILLASVRTLSTLWTDYLWFGSVHFTQVWRRLFGVKVGLFFIFGLIFFAFLWVNLAVVDRLAPSELALGPEDELVRRYQRTIAPHSVLLRTVLSVVLALVAASSAAGQWQNYLLFANGTSFGVKDPQFHRDIGFYVFRLPFEQFLVSWCFVSLIVITLITLAAHYVNGGIRAQQGTPRVAPQVKAHLSVLLAFIALVKGFGYILQRYSLDLATDGYRQGAFYTDVHFRLPALTLLVWLSFAAVLLLLVNIRRQGWTLPVLAVGLWAFVALVAGTIYPAIMQALKVNPAQNQLEKPYIGRNITATRAAMGINHVSQQNFSASQSLTPAEVTANQATLNAVRLWDPDLTLTTYTRLQATRSYYSFNTLALDRYDVNGTPTPMVVGVRQVNDSDLPSAGWVNTHLQYTHGYAMILSAANQADNSGQPTFDISQVPSKSVPGAPVITQPRVYFGIANPSGGDANYVVANSRQAEIDYQPQNASASPVTSTYHGSGGVRLSNVFVKLAFAIRFGDPNLLISDRLDAQSRIMFVRDITEMAEKAAPFLSYDSDPYPVLANGQIYFVLDAYTTSANYPYAQDADTSALASNSGLQQNFNYVRNSVKVVVNAYSGAMTFYDVTGLTHQRDPILETWERAFPHLFTPVSKMPSALLAHLRYPEDLFTVQAAMYGRYHITNPLGFYNATNAWNLSQSPGIGPPNQALPTTFTTNAQGQVVSTGQLARMAPLYEELVPPGQTKLSFNLVDAFVPVSQGDQIQTMSGFMLAASDPGQYGQLTVYQTPPVDGPALADADMTATPAISQEITYLNQNGSTVLLGNVQVVPVGGSMLYFRPFYVESSRNPFPKLDYMIAVYAGQQGQSQVGFDTTLSKVIQDLFQVQLPGQSSTPSSPGTAVSPTVQSLIAQANQDLLNAQNDFKSGNFTGYGQDLQALQQALQQLASASSAASTPTPSSSATTIPKGLVTGAPTTTTTVAPKGGGGSGSTATTGVALPAR